MIYEFQCEGGHHTEIKRPMSEASYPGPPCGICKRETRRVFSIPRWNMFVTVQESFEWADRVMSGQEKITPDGNIKTD